jgi:hypothetical protein
LEERQGQHRRHIDLHRNTLHLRHPFRRTDRRPLRCGDDLYFVVEARHGTMRGRLRRILTPTLETAEIWYLCRHEPDGRVYHLADNIDPET